jgi:hypothetical protein
MIGRTFGKLRVVARYRAATGHHWMAMCKCECGRIHHVRANDLLRGHTKSCSHLRRVGHPHSDAERQQLSRAAIARHAREARKREVRHAAA